VGGIITIDKTLAYHAGDNQSFERLTLGHQMYIDGNSSILAKTDIIKLFWPSLILQYKKLIYLSTDIFFRFV
jgi:lipopolysaccharide biosynthesis glycosyltransferase